ncbi:bifunctional adenosylcobinamide kinase/adenosylcobinamide-phosphate guanylyltransferase [Alkalihalobacillus sp. CinArs1]|uniref:bifunctional adenosylcobinamide kinase/adenosylcobinamide-phosphate guanylyltransferase n=1 Tax=Alkalihalobacillus sp. CinArs1 TaxID=2995314 RepID=UPI0022DE2118|nr:bifunctional adenosylcobinamide kinase/adenosylcobinamide-phosphate guanylyltransferase [Alkalihalobacillus sp. CinArs1]
MADIIFISGGVRSGKSSFAEKLATSHAERETNSLYYIACGEPVDEEMKERIAQHRYDRSKASSWTTVECPVNVGSAAKRIGQGGIVLLDCLTTLLSNELFKQIESYEALIDRIKCDLSIVAEKCDVLIIVSNEVSFEPFDTPLVKTYGKLLGSLHQWVVEQAREAYLVEASIPILMKGEVIE